MNLMLVDNGQICGTNIVGAAADTLAAKYSIKDAQLIKVYSKLDGNLVNQVQRSHLSLHKKQVTSYI